MASADDGKGVVLGLLRTREGRNILAEVYFFICLLHFEVISFQGRGSGRGNRELSRPGGVGWRICSKVLKPL